MKVAVNGLRIGIKHWKEHLDTSKDLVKKVGIFSQKKPAWLQRGIDMFHQLYRPHYNHHHAPRRFHNGIVAEVAYDDSITIVMEDENGEREEGATRLQSKSFESKTTALSFLIAAPHN